MFDVGFFELALIGLVLLVVMGPEKLPEVARQGAFMVRKLRTWLTSMKTEMNAQNPEGMASLQQAKREIAELKSSLSQMGQDVMTEMEGIGEDMQSPVADIEDELLEMENGYYDSEQATDYAEPELLDDEVAGKPEKKPSAKKQTKSAPKKTISKKRISAKSKKAAVNKEASKKTSAKKPKVKANAKKENAK